MRIFVALAVCLAFSISTSAQIIGSKERSFTENKRLEYEYNGIPLTGVLFYISGPITMKRVLPKTKSTDYNPKGRVAFENGRAYEYYELVDGASAIFESESDDQKTMVMRFGQDQDETLRFKKTKGVGNDANNYYVLMSKKGEKEGQNLISFLGKEWELISYASVRLNVKEKRNTKVKVDKTKSRGIKMDGSERKGILGKKKNN